MKNMKKVKLIDKCLILFMIILMSQSIYSLFAHELSSQLTTPIDVAVRTASASILGYFLSVNFLKKSEAKPCCKEEETKEQQKEEEEEAQTSNQQIIIATIIGIVSLCALLCARNFLILTPESTSTLSQLRDFVSGCIGFLLGCPISGHKDEST